uniref:EamA family transporter n=1 Tax=Roseihalotalea indica TaxID=2867963 RepID=A0AA49GS82_9BACT|nr:EamA family transporter [Tunicatimonas sp. TK19036]
MTETSSRRSAVAAWGALGLLALIWGSSFILIKQGLTAFSGSEVGALRIVSAGAFLLPVAIAAFSKLSRRQWGVLLVIGFLGSLIPAFLFAWAQTQLSSSATGIINAVTPLNVLVVGALFFGQSIARKQFLGLGIGLIGTVLLILAGSSGTPNDGFNAYALLVVGATVCYGFSSNIIKHYTHDLKPLTITAVSLALMLPIAGGYLFGYSSFLPSLEQQEAWWPFLAIVTLGVVGTALALIIFNKLIQIRTPVFATSVTYLVPMVAILWGFLDGETLTYLHFLGMSAILGGVYVANRL